MIDINLLRLMRTRSDFNKIISAVNVDALETPVKVLVKAIDRYYKKHTSHGKIDVSVFIPFVERNVYPNWTETDKSVYQAIIKNMHKNYPDSATRQNIMESIHELNLVHTTFGIANSYNEGKEIDPVQEISTAIDKYKLAVGVSTMPTVDNNIDALLDDMGNDSGIHWRLDCLNASMRPLRGGDFGIIAARPDQGKTSFLASELTFMASQLPSDRPLVWLNNEGPGYAIVPRLMQAALNCTTQELLEKKEEGILYDEYWEAIGGKDKIIIMDVHGYNNGQVESLIESTNAGIVVYDMIDNIHGFGDAARTDLALERMYQWAREKGVKYDVIALATSQISADGADEMYPGLGSLKDSKTGKQGACDFQLMIGSQETKAGFAHCRWLSLPKNKLRKLSSSQLHEQVVFDRDRARYRSIENNKDLEKEST